MFCLFTLPVYLQLVLFFSKEYIKQIISIFIGLVLCLIFSFGNYSRMGEWSIYFYIAGIAVLIYTLVFGKVVKRRKVMDFYWQLHLGQPSEIMKVFTILYLSKFYDMRHNTLEKPLTLLTSLGIVIIPMLLILVQPDMGTALVYLPIYFFISLIAGVPFNYLLFLFFTGTGTLILGILPAWNQLIIHSESFFSRIITDVSLWPYFLFILTVFAALAAVGWFKYKRRYFFGWILFYCIASLFPGGLCNAACIEGLPDYAFNSFS